MIKEPTNIRRVALVAGSWSSNIGNAFYNLGAQWLLKSLDLDVFLLPESPQWKSMVAEHYDHVADVDADLFVLVGPCLWSRLADVYTTTFDRIYARGGKVAYLSAGMAHYSSEEAGFVLQFLKKYPPLFVSTRDAATYERISGSLACPTHNGICCSMFLDDALRPIPIYKNPYVVFNFDDVEPDLEISTSGVAKVLSPSRWRQRKPLPLHIDGKEIVRTVNLSIDEGYAKIYARPNSYHSDFARGYCSFWLQLKLYILKGSIPARQLLFTGHRHSLSNTLPGRSKRGIFCSIDWASPISLIAQAAWIFPTFVPRKRIREHFWLVSYAGSPP